MTDEQLFHIVMVHSACPSRHQRVFFNFQQELLDQEDSVWEYEGSL